MISWRVVAILVVCGVLAGWAMLKEDSPIATARSKCESAIERATGHDLSLLEVVEADVQGDALNGSVRLRIERSGVSYVGECVFREGKTERVAVGGKAFTGQ